MSICTKDCGFIPFKPAGFSCNASRRQGGVKHLVFAHCSVSISDFYDLAQWCKYINEGKIVLSNELLANKPEAEAINRKLYTCAPDNYTGSIRTIAFQDFNGDNVYNDDYNFWNYLLKESPNYQFGWITCDDYFYGFDKDFNLEVSNQIEEENTGLAFWVGKVRWTSFYDTEPVFIPNLLTVLRGDCSKVPNFNSCPEDVIVVNRNGRYTLCSPDEELLLEATPLIKGATYTWYKDMMVVATGLELNSYGANKVGEYTVEIQKPGCPLLTLNAGEIILDPSLPLYGSRFVFINGFGRYNIIQNYSIDTQLCTSSRYRLLDITNNVYGPWRPTPTFYPPYDVNPGTYIIEGECLTTGCIVRTDPFNIP